MNYCFTVLTPNIGRPRQNDLFIFTFGLFISVANKFSGNYFVV